MKSGAFPFLRATYWRWAETILVVCPELSNAPQLLAIGDTHLENFGTWRDVEGRLVWGVNDFDESAVMPYVLDLVRLAVSAALTSADEGGPTVGEICAKILKGYRHGLKAPEPIVLERNREWLRRILLLKEKRRAKFWSDIAVLAEEAPPDRFLAALQQVLPNCKEQLAFFRRTAGTGSLGRPRFIAFAKWRGGPVIREAKALVRPAWALAHSSSDRSIKAQKIADGRCRSPDPHYRVVDSIVVRRLSPNARKIEAEGDAVTLLSPDMLELMGFEIANCHADDDGRRHAVISDLRNRDKDWLSKATMVAAQFVETDQRKFTRVW